MASNLQSAECDCAVQVLKNKLAEVIETAERERRLYRPGRVIMNVLMALVAMAGLAFMLGMYVHRRRPGTRRGKPAPEGGG